MIVLGRILCEVISDLFSVGSRIFPKVASGFLTLTLSISVIIPEGIGNSVACYGATVEGTTWEYLT